MEKCMAGFSSSTSFVPAMGYAIHSLEGMGVQ
jgi:hypothetical protein